MIKGASGPSALWSRIQASLVRPGVRHGLAMLVAATLANVLDYAYNVAMGRLLSADGYGVLVALQALLQIVSVSMVVGSTVMARYVAAFTAREQWGRMAAFVRVALRNTALWGGGAALFLALLSGPVARQLQISTVVPVLVIAAALLPMVVKLVPIGTLQGLQKFNALGATQVAQAAFRLLLGVLLVKLGLDAVGALAALPVGTAGTVLLGLVFMGSATWQRTDESHQVSTADLARYAGTTIVGVVSFAALTNIDALVVKHYFSPTEAGHYSMAVTLGKVVIFMPAAFAQVLFPKSAERYVQQRDSSRLLRWSLLATLLPCVGLTAVYFVAPTLLLRTAFGTDNPFAGPVLGWVALAMSVYALVNVWLNYFLSVEQTRFVYALSVALVVQFILLILFHASLIQVITMVTITGVGVLIFAEVWFRFYARTRSSLLGRRTQVNTD